MASSMHAHMRTFRGFLMLGLVLFMLFVNECAHAIDMWTYNLDSLIYMSSDVVEATLIRSFQEEERKLAEVKVTAVHKGSFTIGQSVIAADLNSYAKWDATTHANTAPLENGDALILFLQKTGSSSLPPANVRIYFPVPSVKLVQENKVISFRQHTDIAPFKADSDSQQNPFPTLENYRTQIQAGIARTDKLATQWKDPSAVDVPGLLGLLRENEQVATSRNQRRAIFKPDEDFIPGVACQLLANLHNLNILNEMLSLKLPDYRYILAHGFATPAGRNFLLKMIGNEQEPLEKRLQYAGLLTEAGAEYHTTSTALANGLWRTTGSAQKGNAAYLTRIARLALKTQQHEELCLSLLRSEDEFFRVIDARSETLLYPDVWAALPVLKQLYTTTKSERLRFEVEIAIAHGSRNAYNRLGSPAGQVLSLLTPVAPPESGKSAGRSVYFSYRIIVLDDLPEDAPLPAIVLMNGATGKTWVIPSQIRYWGKSASGYGLVALPKELPPGRYRLYLRFTRNGKIMSTGHFSEVNVK
ncbi:MAG: hypothetical protein ACYDBB_21105 [Armatimonadota bacterium]